MNAVLARIGALAFAVFIGFAGGLYVSALVNAKDTLKIARADQAAQNAASDAAAKSGTALELTATENQNRVNDLVISVETRADRGACRLTAADLERLRSIK